jgi:hypothetical protein
MSDCGGFPDDRSGGIEQFDGEPKLRNPYQPGPPPVVDLAGEKVQQAFEEYLEIPMEEPSSSNSPKYYCRVWSDKYYISSGRFPPHNVLPFDAVLSRNCRSQRHSAITSEMFRSTTQFAANCNQGREQWTDVICGVASQTTGWIEQFDGEPTPESISARALFQWLILAGEKVQQAFEEFLKHSRKSSKLSSTLNPLHMEC